MPGLQYPFPNVPMLGKGSVLLDIFDLTTGLGTGLQHLGNVPTFEIEDKPDKANLYSAMNKSVSKIATALKKRDLTLALKGTDFNTDHLAVVAMSAGKTVVTVAAGAVVTEPLISIAQAAVCKGRFFRTLNPIDITTPPVVAQGSTTLVLGTDYTVSDPVMGMIFIPKGSTIAAGTAVVISYTKLAKVMDSIGAATVPFVTGRILFDPDPVDGQKLSCEIWRVNLNQNGKFGLISDDYGNWELEGDILDDSVNHPTMPFYELRGV